MTRKCPIHHFQQDGHMAMMNPKGRVNYNPNSWQEEGGPREHPEKGFNSYPAEENGEKMRVRSDRFADHYSQARQFYVSQTDIEKSHIADAFIFELSKTQPKIRQRMVAHLLNVDKDLAKNIAEGLQLKKLPSAARPAKSVKSNLAKSKALSILLNGPKTFKGRKVGILITEGADAKIYKAIQTKLKNEGATFDIISSFVGDIKLSDQTVIQVNENIRAGFSVLYDAVILLLADKGMNHLLKTPEAYEFIQDAHVHLKYIGYVTKAMELIEKACLKKYIDNGYYLLDETKNIDSFIKACRNIRYWKR